MCLLVVLVP